MSRTQYWIQDVRDILEAVNFIKERMVSEGGRSRHHPRRSAPDDRGGTSDPSTASCTRSATTWKTCVIASRTSLAIARRSITPSSASPPLKSISASIANKSPDQRAPPTRPQSLIRPLVFCAPLFPSKSGLTNRKPLLAATMQPISQDFHSDPVFEARGQEGLQFLPYCGGMDDFWKK